VKGKAVLKKPEPPAPEPAFTIPAASPRRASPGAVQLESTEPRPDLVTPCRAPQICGGEGLGGGELEVDLRGRVGAGATDLERGGGTAGGGGGVRVGCCVIYQGNTMRVTGSTIDGYKSLGYLGRHGLLCLLFFFFFFLFIAPL
jgi:hypothetical protein